MAILPKTAESILIKYKQFMDTIYFPNKTKQAMSSGQERSGRQGPNAKCQFC
jgi:hypothetical protein